MKRLLIAATAALATGAVRAAPIGFAINTDLDVYRIDFGIGSATLVGGHHAANNVQGIANDASGNLFGTSSNGDLYSINPITGEATLIGSTGLGNLEGLDFNGGTLITSDFNSTPTLYELNTSTGAATAIVTADQATGSVRSMTVLDANTVLVRSDIDATLRTIDLNTGVTSILASNVPSLSGMDILSDGNLYGVYSSGRLYSINPINGQTTQIGDTGSQFWLGLTAAVGGSCPWDCGDGDGTVGIVDFLALLAQWGQFGTSCDFGGAGVDIIDFLTLLGHWGACAAGGCGGPAAGNCCIANGSPGCDDPECCTAVCSVGPFCCDVAWDQMCVDTAVILCPGCRPDPPACGVAGTGDCCIDNGTPFCDDFDCCDFVCLIDPFCCDVAWDPSCASTAAQVCFNCP